ncbi:hypothetical protein BURPSS13_J0291 [Burkholderia pseudomallei S13]|nr:hypothetical protein BURPSS13_J0291 [Burkholderia pseudomallei S13]
MPIRSAPIRSRRAVTTSGHDARAVADSSRPSASPRDMRPFPSPRPLPPDFAVCRIRLIRRLQG